MIISEHSIFVPIPTPQVIAATCRIQEWVRSRQRRQRILEDRASCIRRIHRLTEHVIHIQRSFRKYMSRLPRAPPPSPASESPYLRESLLIRLQAVWRGHRIRRRISRTAFRESLEQLRELRECIFHVESGLLSGGDEHPLRADLYLELEHRRAQTAAIVTADGRGPMVAGKVWMRWTKWPVLTLSDFKRLSEDDDLGFGIDELETRGC